MMGPDRPITLRSFTTRLRFDDPSQCFANSVRQFSAQIIPPNPHTHLFHAASRAVQHIPLTSPTLKWYPLRCHASTEPRPCNKNVGV